MDWKQATFHIPESWRDQINNKAAKWGCDPASIWMAAIDTFFRDGDAKAKSIRFISAHHLGRSAFGDVQSEDAHRITDEIKIASHPTGSETIKPPETPPTGRE